MRALFDVNVLIALFDEAHLMHDSAHSWWEANSSKAWASCPITENGCVRIMSNPAYETQARFSPGEILERLKEFAEASDHEFWPDDISLTDDTTFDRTLLVSHRRLTDLYLVALAAKRRGSLVTFDQGITIGAVRTATSENLTLIA